jgi:hypothetical protein
MTEIHNAQPTPPATTRKSGQSEKQQEMERVQEEAAQERATEGGYQ